MSTQQKPVREEAAVDEFEKFIRQRLDDPTGLGATDGLLGAMATPIGNNQMAFFIEYVSEGGESKYLALVMTDKFARAVGQLLSTA